MEDYETILLNLVRPIANNADSISVERRDSGDDDNVVLVVYASSADIGHLIGRKGQMARAIRDTMAIAGRVDNKRISIKFEEC